MEDKVLFRVKCLSGFQGYYIEGKTYKFYENKGLKAEDGNFKFSQCKTFKDFTVFSQAEWELVEEETLLDKFYDMVGVEDMEVFSIKQNWSACEYRFNKGYLQIKYSNEKIWEKSDIALEELITGKLTLEKLPSKPIFSNKEKEQIKHIYGLFGECWIGRDKDDTIWVFNKKARKRSSTWDSDTIYQLKDNVLPFIKWEDTEPFKVDKQLIESFKE